MVYKVHCDQFNKIDTLFYRVLPELVLTLGVYTLWQHSDFVWCMLIIILTSYIEKVQTRYIGYLYQLHLSLIPRLPSVLSSELKQKSQPSAVQFPQHICFQMAKKNIDEFSARKCIWTLKQSLGNWVEEQYGECQHSSCAESLQSERTWIPRIFIVCWQQEQHMTKRLHGWTKGMYRLWKAEFDRDLSSRQWRPRYTAM